MGGKNKFIHLCPDKEYIPIDAAAKDGEFYRQMREFDALHPDIP